jgi:Outer membrane protein beta-barrel domain
VDLGQLRATAITVAVAAALAGAEGTARAAGEAEWQLSMRLGAANVSLGSIDPRAPWGMGGALDLEYGITDAWAGRISIGGSLHPVSPNMQSGLQAGEVTATTALVGVTYTFDVLRLVPYAEIGLGLVRFGGAVNQPRSTLASELGVGADYLLTRRWACGVSFQYLFAPGDLVSNAMDLGSSPYTFSATLRASRIF